VEKTEKNLDKVKLYWKERLQMFKLICCALAFLVISAEPAWACVTSEKDRKAHFSKIDLDKNGELSFDEFFASKQGTSQYGRSEEFRQQQKESFSKLDYDHSGQLTFQEYQPIFNEVNCL
jgi:hypothetical protein